MNVKSLLLAAMLGTAGGVVGAYGIVKTQKTDTRKSTPIVIVDLASLSASLDGKTQPLVTAITKLKDAGYLVLDANAVISAPDDLYLTAELLPPN